MKALVYLGPKKLAVQDVPKPEPKAGEVLLKIRSVGICGSDVHGYLGTTGRRIEPMVMGHEFSAEVVALGQDTVRGFKPGDRVVVQPVNFCGSCANCEQGYTNLCLNRDFYGVLDVDGALAEYIAVPEKLLYALPDALSYDVGALIEPIAVSYAGVKKAGDLTGKRVLVVGAGTIGLLALACAKVLGPKQIVVSDLSEFRLKRARDMGADATINPGVVDFEAEVNSLTDDERFDVTIEAVGVGATVNQALQAVKSNGICVWIGNNAKTIELDMQYVVTNAITIHGTYIYTHEEFGETLDFVKNADLDFGEIVSKRITLDEAADMFEELLTATEKYVKVVVAFDD